MSTDPKKKAIPKPVDVFSGKVAIGGSPTKPTQAKRVIPKPSQVFSGQVPVGKPSQDLNVLLGAQPIPSSQPLKPTPQQKQRELFMPVMEQDVVRTPARKPAVGLDFYNPSEVFNPEKVEAIKPIASPFDRSNVFLSGVESLNTKRYMGKMKEANEEKNNLAKFIQKKYGLSSVDSFEFVDKMSEIDNDLAGYQYGEQPIQIDNAERFAPQPEKDQFQLRTDVTQVKRTGGVDPMYWNLDKKIEEFKQTPSAVKTTLKSFVNSALDMRTGIDATGTELIKVFGGEEWDKKLDESHAEFKKSMDKSKYDVNEFESETAQLIGSAAPSFVPIVGGVAVSLYNPILGGKIANTGFAALSASAAGNYMDNYRSYQAGKGEDVDLMRMYSGAVGTAAVEYFTERMGFGGKVVRNGQLLQRAATQISPEAAERMGVAVLQQFKRTNPREYAKMIREIPLTANKEGFSEALASLGQESIENAYKSLEDKSDVNKIFKNMIDSYKVGAVMAGAVGPLSYKANNKFHQERRKKQGGVLVVESKGNAFEVLRRIKTKEGVDAYEVMSPEGNTLEIKADQVNETYQLSAEQFDNILKGKVSEGAAVENSRVELAQQAQVEIDQAVDQQLEGMTFEVDGQKFIMPAEMDGVPVFILGRKDDRTFVVADPETGQTKTVIRSRLSNLKQAVSVDQVKQMERENAGVAYIPEGDNLTPPQTGEMYADPNLGNIKVVGYNPQTGDVSIEIGEGMVDVDGKNIQPTIETIPRASFDAIRTANKEAQAAQVPSVVPAQEEIVEQEAQQAEPFDENGEVNFNQNANENEKDDQNANEAAGEKASAKADTKEEGVLVDGTIQEATPQEAGDAQAQQQEVAKGDEAGRKESAQDGGNDGEGDGRIDLAKQGEEGGSKPDSKADRKPSVPSGTIQELAPQAEQGAAEEVAPANKRTINVGGYKLTDTPSMKDGISIEKVDVPKEYVENGIYVSDKKGALKSGVKRLSNGWIEVGRDTNGDVQLYNEETGESVRIKSTKGGRMGVILQDFVENNIPNTQQPNTPDGAVPQPDNKGVAQVDSKKEEKANQGANDKKGEKAETNEPETPLLDGTEEIAKALSRIRNGGKDSVYTVAKYYIDEIPKGKWVEAAKRLNKLKIGDKDLLSKMVNTLQPLMQESRKLDKKYLEDDEAVLNVDNLPKSAKLTIKEGKDKGTYVINADRTVTKNGKEVPKALASRLFDKANELNKRYTDQPRKVSRPDFTNRPSAERAWRADELRNELYDLINDEEGNVKGDLDKNAIQEKYNELVSIAKIEYERGNYGNPGSAKSESLYEGEIEDINAYVKDVDIEKVDPDAMFKKEEYGAFSSEQRVQAEGVTPLDDKGAPITEKSPAEPSEKVDLSNLQDAGEKIGGAKKDLVASLNSATSEDIRTKPLSKVFPEPDYQKLVADGTITVEGAISLRFLYKSIPPKPRKKYRLDQWVKTVESAIKTVTEIVEKKQDFHGAILKSNSLLAEPYRIYAETLKGLGFPENIPNLGNYEIKKFTSSGNTQRYTVVSGSIIVSKDHETLEQAIESLKKILENNQEKESKSTITFDVYQDRKTKEYFVGKKKNKDVVRLMQGFKTAKEADTYRKENAAQLQEMWDALKIKVEERREDNRTRIGADYRKGRNITSKELMETFGFRGVEFGNWVEGKARQESVNDAYDALMDMAVALNVSPKAISLNGGLGLAFGARGSGKAMAHYESDKVVINLTKTKGAGSLAHEWWHAMDNYFGKKRGESSGFLTDNPQVRVVRTPDGFKDDTRIRKETVDAFKGVMDTIRKSGLRKRSQKLDTSRSKDYWSTAIEMSARSFENYIIEKLAATSQQNDYLANFKETSEWLQHSGLDLENYPYPLKEESPEINEAFDQLFNTLEQRETETGVALFQILEQKTPTQAAIRSSIQASLDMLPVLQGTDETNATTRLMRPDAKSNKQNVATRVQKLFTNFKNPPEVIVYESHLDLAVNMPDLTRRMARQGSVYGFSAAFIPPSPKYPQYPNGFVVMVASHPKFMAKGAALSRSIANTTFHETFGHFGLRGWLDQVATKKNKDAKEKGATKDETNWRAELNTLLDALVPQMDKKTLDDVARLYSGGKFADIDKSTEAGASKYYEVLEEYLAKRAEQRADDSLVAQLINWIKDQLAKKGWDRFVDEADIRRALINSRRFVQVGREGNFVDIRALKQSNTGTNTELPEAFQRISEVEKQAIGRQVTGNQLAALEWRLEQLNQLPAVAKTKEVQDEINSLQQERDDVRYQFDLFGNPINKTEDLPATKRQDLNAKLKTATKRLAYLRKLPMEAKSNLVKEEIAALQKDVIRINEALANTLREDEARAGGEQMAMFQIAPPTDSKAFKDWFGDSKVVDENGKPLVVYHGTKGDFSIFDLRKSGATDSGLLGKGVYLTFSPSQASFFATDSNYGNTGSPNVMPVFASIKNPLIIENGKLPDGRRLTDLHPNGLTVSSSRKINQELKSLGHDGAIFIDGGEIVQVVAFSPTQIKSATGNIGTYDPNNPDIRFQQEAYHGSTQLFDRFMPEFIGSGTSKQKFGWGLYFTNKDTVAKVFGSTASRATLKKNAMDPPGSVSLKDAQKAINFYRNKSELLSAIDSMGRFTRSLKIGVEGETIRLSDKKAFRDWVDSNVEQDKYLYKTTLHKGKKPENYNYMKWDKAVTPSQAAKVKTLMGKGIFAAEAIEQLTGAQLYESLTNHYGSQKEASMKLLEAGIDGIEYPNVQTYGGEATNYVVFDAAAVEIEESVRYQIDAYHGSPFKFDQFSSKKIGKGHGGSTYGWGLYFTDKKTLAKEYGKNVYEVSIHKGKTPDQYSILEWDKPFPDEYFDKIGKQAKAEGNMMLEMLSKDFNRSNQTGQSVYRNISQLLSSDKEASLFLLRSGIDGIKFQQNDAMNYVVFDPNTVTIEERSMFQIAPPTDSKEFKKWFGDSKIVDAEGKPKIVYHGTSADFDEFKNKRGTHYFGSGFYFSSRGRENVSSYGSKVMELYLSIQNPFIEGESEFNAGRPLVAASIRPDLIKKEYQKNGFDGVVLRRGWIIAFEPTQIKSATGNNGQFDGNNPDIRYQIVGEKGATALDAYEEVTYRMDNLQVAKEMDDQGKSAKKIKMATGWEKGADGKWRYETEDFQFKDTEEMLTIMLSDKEKTFKLGDIIDNPSLFKAYENASELPITFKEEPAAAAYFDPNNKRFVVDTRRFRNVHEGSSREAIKEYTSNLRGLRKLILHELTHFVQGEEGFARGGSVQEFENSEAYIISDEERRKIADTLQTLEFLIAVSDKKKISIQEAFDRIKGTSNPDIEDRVSNILYANRGDLSSIKKTMRQGTNLIRTPEQKYKALAGEQEARAISARIDFTEIRRRTRLLSQDESIDREDQIIFLNTFKQLSQEDTQEVRFQFSTEGLDYNNPADNFYSNTLRAIQGISMPRATGEQWKAMLLNTGASQAELNWIGFDDFLKDNPKPTKEEVQEFVRMNQVEITEVVKGSAPKVTRKDVTKVVFSQEGTGSYLVYMNGIDGLVEIGTSEADSESEAIDAAIERANDSFADYRNNSTKYSQYTLPGGENYREVLLTMPVSAGPPANVSFDQWNKNRKSWGLSEGTYDEYMVANKESGYKSSHWDELQILSHIRLNDRNVGGEKVLFIEEIQSDWAQEGRKKGWKSDMASVLKRIAEIEQRRSELTQTTVEVKNTLEFVTEMTQKYGEFKSYLLTDSERAKLDELKSKKEQAKSSPEFLAKQKEYESLGEELRGLNKISYSTPDMPFKQTSQWVNLALRRVIRMASEQGYDRVAWVTGEQSAERYDLSKQVDRLSIAKNIQGKYLVIGLKDGNQVINKNNVEETELEGLVGKDIAVKAIKGQSSFEGLDLKVGGEGMKAFYDTILPTQAKKVLAKIDKTVKVEGIELELAFATGEEYLDYTEKNGGQMPQQLSFPISPAIREIAISEGMPMFQKTPLVGESGSTTLSYLDRKRQTFQDSMIYLKRLQEKAAASEYGFVDDASDAHSEATLKDGRIKAQYEKFRVYYLDPLKKIMLRMGKEHKVDYDTISRYLKAKHIVADNIEAGGIPMAEAQKLVNDFEARVPAEKVKEMNDLLRMMTHWDIQQRYEYGLLTEDQFKTLSSMYTHYVPLKGWESVTMDDETTFSVMKERKGRTTESADPIAYIDVQTHSTIIMGEKNLFKLSFLRFAEMNPDSRVYNLKNVWYVQNDDGTWRVQYSDPGQALKKAGKARQTAPDTDSMSAEELLKHYANVKLGGKERELLIYREGRPVVVELVNADLARALAKQPVSQRSRFMEVYRATYNYMRAVRTQYSPEFAFTNYLRDVTFGVNNIFVDHGFKMSAEVLNDVTLKNAYSRNSAFYVVRRAVFNNDFSGDGRYFKEFAENGGMTGWSDMKEVRKIYTNIKSEVEGNRSKMRYTGIPQLLKFIDKINETIENTVRFATYRALRKRGISAKKAAIYAKDLTVNFNRKGQNSAINNYFMFFNAGVQGTERLTRPYGNKQTDVRVRLAASVAGVMALQTLASVLSRSIGGEDDEGMSYYDKLPEYTRSFNWVLPNIFSDQEGDFIYIPKPYGLNFYSTVADHIIRGYLNVEGAGQATSGILTGAANAFVPVDIASDEDNLTALGGLFKTITPTIIKPQFELMVNRNFAGSPIYKEPFMQDETPKPDSQMAFKNVNPAIRELAVWMNDATGGTVVEPGYVDINPESIEHYVESYTGGVGKFGSNTYTFTHNLVTGGAEKAFDVESRNINKVPFLRKFVGANPDFYFEQSEFYENLAKIRDAHNMHQDYKSKIDKEGRVDLEPVLIDFENRNDGILDLHDKVGAIKDEVKKLRDDKEVLEGTMADAKTEAERAVIELNLKNTEKATLAQYRLLNKEVHLADPKYKKPKKMPFE
jgi:hypothetical protein